MTARTLFLAALRWVCGLAGLWAAAVYATGGFSLTIAGLRVSSHNPSRPFTLAVLALIIHVIFAGIGGTRLVLERATRRFKPGYAAAALVVVVAAIGLINNSGTASGADSYGYVSQADLWLRGRLMTPVPAALEAPWPDALWTFAPLGYRPAPHGAFLVPTYAPGLPMLMAGAKAVAGYKAVYFLVPLFAALLVAMTYLLGRRLKSEAAGLAAACLVAASPVLLHMLMLPMSDVPAAALWAVALLCALAGSPLAAGAAGLAASMAVLIRPNLAPLAGVLALWIGWRDLRARGEGKGFGRTIGFLAGLAPGFAAVAAINAVLYGSPATSGYGTVGEIYSLANVPANLMRYGGWLVETQTLAVLAGLAALFFPLKWLWRDPDKRRAAMLLALAAGTVIVSYCLYIPFGEWMYLRFLLPAWPAIFIALTVLLTRISESAEKRWNWAKGLWVVAVAALCLYGLFEARARGVYAAGAVERRYAAVAALVEARTEPAGVVFAMQHSGSLGYYGARTTIRYDFLDPSWLDRAVDFLRGRGLHPYLLLDDWERARFQSRFAATSRLSRLEMPPAFIYRGAVDVYFYDLAADLSTARPTEELGDVPAPRAAVPHPAPPLILGPSPR